MILKFFRESRKYYKFLIALAGIVFLVGGTLFALRWARGYRPTFGRKGPALTGTGLLVVSSDPKGAQVFINGKLTTATDDTLNLPPQVYGVEIRKDGYITWKKTLQISSELVTQTSTKLFPSVPNLTPLTFTGARSPSPSPDGQKIAYKVSSASVAANNGIWVLEMNERNFSIARASVPKHIARNSQQYNFLDATLVWTPNSTQILAYWIKDKEPTGAGKKQKPKTEVSAEITQAILLGTGGMNDEASLRDVTSRLPVLLAQWHQDLDLNEQDRFDKLPKEMQEIATSSASAVFFSPDELKLLYQAKGKLTIPDHLIADLPSESTQRQERDIQINGIYVYDIKEDRNYRVGDVNTPITNGGQTVGQPASSGEESDYWTNRLINPVEVSSNIERSQSSPPKPLPPVAEKLLSTFLTVLRNRYSPIWHHTLQWFPTSEHLLKRNESTVSVVEFDGTNDATVYAGPFDQSFVYPWPNGSKIVILASFNNSSPTNLYALNLK